MNMIHIIINIHSIVYYNKNVTNILHFKHKTEKRLKFMEHFFMPKNFLMKYTFLQRKDNV